MLVFMKMYFIYVYIFINWFISAIRS